MDKSKIMVAERQRVEMNCEIVEVVGIFKYFGNCFSRRENESGRQTYNFFCNEDDV